MKVSFLGWRSFNWSTKTCPLHFFLFSSSSPCDLIWTETVGRRGDSFGLIVPSLNWSDFRWMAWRLESCISNNTSSAQMEWVIYWVTLPSCTRALSISLRGRSTECPSRVRLASAPLAWPLEDASRSTHFNLWAVLNWFIGDTFQPSRDLWLLLLSDYIMKHFDWKLIYFFIRHHHRRARIYCEPLVTWPRSPWLSSTSTTTIHLTLGWERGGEGWSSRTGQNCGGHRADNFKIESVPETTQTEPGLSCCLGGKFLIKNRLNLCNG